MKERPILFTGPMVNAILAGRKTETRRIVKVRQGERLGCYSTDGVHGVELVYADSDGDPLDREGPKCPYGSPGDRLWVKETWQAIHVSIDLETGSGDDVEAAAKIPPDSADGYWGVAYRATDRQADESKEDRGFAWRPSIFMPRWASRLTLDVVSIRAERVQDIDAAGAIAEGVDVFKRGNLYYLPGNGDLGVSGPRTAYSLLWDSIHGRSAWEENSWVWVVGFQRRDGGGK